MEMIPSRLILESGEIFEGLAPAWQRGRDCFAEVVFTTGMTGYVESLTDPSYAGQILTFTFPLIGNYGVPRQTLWESDTIRACGVILSQLSGAFSHYEATCSLLKWLEKERIPLLTQVDTRALTKHLRTKGTQLGVITHRKTKPKTFWDPNLTQLPATVSVQQPVLYGSGRKRVVAVDCGMKENILRCLLRFDVAVQRVPYDYDYTNEAYDGIFLSNGPGDPKLCVKTIRILQKALTAQKPLFGICLGAQLLALSVGASTFKLPFGHRGQNHPCIDNETGRCLLTSQNHGYAIEREGIPKDWKITHTHLNDNSVEGIAHRSLPFFAVQFHPEASPGPTDAMGLFDKFYQLL